jgi:dolichol-phosphate mannosyltransferase
MVKRPAVSIVIPTLNEAGNIRILIDRIGRALSARHVYEIIFIDDHSTDSTVKRIRQAAREPESNVSVYKKSGEAGKAYSLVEGFNRASHPFICMIDADLQYPPEAIPGMVDELVAGADVVVANRSSANEGTVRRMFSTVGRRVYGKWLHGLDCDVQSGLKVFRREVWTSINLRPQASWTFDLEFLVLVRNHGYKITTYAITFAKRVSGKSKINVIGAGLQIMMQAIRLKFTNRGQRSQKLAPREN